MEQNEQNVDQKTTKVSIPLTQVDYGLGGVTVLHRYGLVAFYYVLIQILAFKED